MRHTIFEVILTFTKLSDKLRIPQRESSSSFEKWVNASHNAAESCSNFFCLPTHEKREGRTSKQGPGSTHKKEKKISIEIDSVFVLHHRISTPSKKNNKKTARVHTHSSSAPLSFEHSKCLPHCHRRSLPLRRPQSSTLRWPRSSRGRLQVLPVER